MSGTTIYGGGPGRIYEVTPDGELKFLTNLTTEEFIFVPADLNKEIDPKHPLYASPR